MLESESDFEKGQNLVFQELGKFLATFEQTVYMFRNNIASILKYNGLKNDTYSDILLSKQTAEPILTIFQAMVPYYFENKHHKFFNSLIRETRYLIEIRNIIIHCFWAIGVGTENYKDVSIYGIKQKTSKLGISNYNLNLELKDLKEINEILFEFSELCFEINQSIKKEQNDYDKFENEINKTSLKSFVEKFNKTE